MHASRRAADRLRGIGTHVMKHQRRREFQSRLREGGKGESADPKSQRAYQNKIQQTNILTQPVNEQC
jgi:hypothetical protein